MKALASLVSSALLLVNLPAQSPEVRERIVSETPIAEVESATVIDIDNDCNPDYAFLFEGTLHVSASPQIWSWVYNSQIGHLADISALSYGCGTYIGNNVGYDGVLAVRNDDPPEPGEVLGMRMINYANGMFRQVPLVGWDAVRRISTGPWDPILEKFVVVGLEPANDRLLVGLWGPASAMQTIGQVDGLTDAHEVLLADWDHADPSALEVIVRRTNGLDVVDQAGGRIVSIAHPTPNTEGSIARMRTPLGDEIVWIRLNTNTGNWEYVSFAGGTAYAPEILFSATDREVLNAAIADADGDSYGDLLLLTHDHAVGADQYAYVYVSNGTGAGAGFDVSTPQPISLGERTAADRSQVVFADFNNDRNPGVSPPRLADAAIITPSEGRLEVAMEPLNVLAGDSDPDILPNELNENAVTFEVSPSSSDDYRVTSLRLDVPLRYREMTHAQIEPFRLNLDDSTDELKHSLGRKETIPASGQLNLTYDFPRIDGVPANTQFQDNEVYFLVVRYVKIDQNETVRVSTPEYLYMFAPAAEEDSSDEDIFARLQAAGLVSATDELDEEEFTAAVARTGGTGIVKKSRIIIPFQTSQIPTSLVNNN